MKKQIKQISRLFVNRFANSELILPPYNSNATADWIRNQSGLPWLPLDIDIPYHQILTEIANIESMLTVHRDDYSEHHGWSSFCIHGKAYNATREDEYYSDSRPHIWTPEAIKLMPNTVEFFKNWPADNFMRLRVMKLSAGGYISVHSDSNVNRLEPINIAITQPAECKFIVDKVGPVPFAPGKAMLLNVSNQHAVVNDSNEVRWHLIVHQRFNNQFNELIVSSYKKLYNKD